MKTDYIQVKYHSKLIGPLYLVASSIGIVGVYWSKQDFPLSKAASQNKILMQAKTELDEYFQGERISFTVALDLRGTPFQLSVWKELLKISYAKTKSYAEIANRIKKPTAVRAVGTAIGKNPVCILIPCHRVIGSNGSLTGFSGGLDTKIKLLHLESEE